MAKIAAFSWLGAMLFSVVACADTASVQRGTSRASQSVLSSRLDILWDTVHANPNVTIYHLELLSDLEAQTRWKSFWETHSEQPSELILLKGWLQDHEKAALDGFRDDLAKRLGLKEQAFIIEWAVVTVSAPAEDPIPNEDSYIMFGLIVFW